MIDSGSNICIINKSTYNKLISTPLITINKKTREVMTAGGPARLIKIVDNFMVIVNDSVIKLNSLYVGLDLQYDVILGSNVLRVSNLCLNLSSGQLCKTPNTLPQCHLTVLNNNSELTTPIINMLFDKYNMAFSINDFDLGNCQIFAKKQTYLPIDKINKKNPYYECPLHMQSEALALAEKLVQSNVLSRGMGDVIHPVILIRKPNGKQRFIADLRRVNSITEKMVSQISTANNLLSSLQCFKYISKFDLTQGFFQIKINSDEKRYYGIKIGEHYFYYNTLIQGSKNSSILFVSVMQDIYSTINNFTHSKIYIYVDDIIVVTHTNRQDHIEALECLLQTTIKYGLKLSPDKSQLLATETIFLGNHITQNTRKIEQSHITKLLQKNKPETPSQLLSFLQSIQFYREYFRKIHIDITELYKYTSTDRNLKHKKLNMPTSTWKHYDNIINELKENTGLHLYIPGYPIEVHCDASSYGIGGMLCQRVPQHILNGHDLKIGKHKDAVLVPLSFYSKTLPSVKRKRCPTFTEIYSILHCLRYWSYILYNIEFSVFSDHKPLVSLRVSSSIPKFVEILTELESYNFTLYYIEGPKNHFPDYLSRLQKPPDVTSAIPCDFKNLNIQSNNSTVDPMTQMLLRLNRYLKSNDFLNFQDNNGMIQQLLLNKKLGNLLIRRDKSKIIKIRTQLMGSEEYIWLPLITSEKLKDIVPNLDSHLMKTVLEEFVYVLTDNGKEVEINMTINNETPTINWDNINLKIALENDVFLKGIKENEDKWRNFKFFEENDIYKVKDELDSDSKPKIYIPSSLEETIFDMLHKKANHPSYDKMRIMLKEIFIPSKTKKLLDYLRKCATCLQRNIALKSDNQKLKPVKMDEVYTTLSFDYLGEIEADTKGRKYILVVICNASTFIWSFPMRTTGTQELLKKLHKMFTQFGRPEKLHRDNARGNLGKELLEYCNSWKIQTSTSTPNYSRSNCLVERKLRDMQAILSKKLIDYKMSRTKVYWSDLLPEVTYQLNTTPILKCEVTPFQIMFSRKGRNYLDLFLQRYSPYESSKADPIFQSSKLALDIVQEHQQTERFRHRERVNVSKNDLPKIKVGQSVYLKDSNPRKAKLSSHYKGPYEVHEIASNHVIITDKNGKKIKCHIKNLKIIPSND